MSVMIEAIAGTVKLQVTGDIETILTVPFDDDDRFLVGLSDGTLLLGTYDEQLRCAWTVQQEGAGIVHISGEAVTLEWRIEWITASIYDGNIIGPPEARFLPLFPDLDRWVA